MSAYWLFERDDTDICTLFVKDGIGKRIARDLQAARRAFTDEYQNSSVPLTLSGNYEAIPVGDPRWNFDVAFYGWLPTFSEKARALLVAHGCDVQDFMSCHFNLLPERKYYFHLTQEYQDVVDMKRSKFHMMLPMDPHCRWHQFAGIETRWAQMPECFMHSRLALKLLFEI